jgi:hypothetical protein
VNNSVHANTQGDKNPQLFDSGGTVQLPPGRRQPAETCRPQPLQSQSIPGNKDSQLCDSGDGTVKLPHGRRQPVETCRPQPLKPKICRGEKYPNLDGTVLPNPGVRVQPTVRPRGRLQPLRSTSCDGNKTPQLFDSGGGTAEQRTCYLCSFKQNRPLVTRIPSSVQVYDQFNCYRLQGLLQYIGLVISSVICNLILQLVSDLQ